MSRHLRKEKEWKYIKEVFRAMAQPYRAYSFMEFLKMFNKHSLNKIKARELSFLLSHQRVYHLFKRKSQRTMFILVPKEHIKD